MGDVADVRVVEEVVVCAELEACFAVAQDGERVREELDVAFAEDCGGS